MNIIDKHNNLLKTKLYVYTYSITLIIIINECLNALYIEHI